MISQETSEMEMIKYDNHEIKRIATLNTSEVKQLKYLKKIARILYQLWRDIFWKWEVDKKGECLPT
jgi:hypothetical protein